MRSEFSLNIVGEEEQGKLTEERNEQENSSPGRDNGRDYLVETISYTKAVYYGVRTSLSEL